MEGTGAVDGVDAVEVRVVAGVGVAAADVGVVAGALLLVSSSPRWQEGK